MSCKKKTFKEQIKQDFRLAKRIRIPKGSKIEIRRGYGDHYGDDGTWVKYPELFIPEFSHKEIPNDMREGLAMMFDSYVEKYIEPIFKKLLKEDLWLFLV